MLTIFTLATCPAEVFRKLYMAPGLMITLSPWLRLKTSPSISATTFAAAAASTDTSSVLPGTTRSAVLPDRGGSCMSQQKQKPVSRRARMPSGWREPSSPRTNM